MIEALYQLGKALATEGSYSDYFATYANPFPKSNKKGQDLVWVFPIDGEGRVGRLEVETFNPLKLSRYLYRKPKGARGAPLVATGPAYPVSDPSDPDKRPKHLENVEKLMSRIERSIPADGGVYFNDSAIREKGLEEVRRQLNEEPGTAHNRYLYTFTINGKYLGEIFELVELLDDEAYDKYHEKSKSTNKTCAVSGDQDLEVWGRVDTLGFTVNDVAFSRGGFNDKTSYRMFPVGKQAAKVLEGAKRFAFGKLTERFGTLEFMVLPHLVEPSTEITLDVLEELADKPGKSKVIKPLLAAHGMLDRIANRSELQRNGLLFDILFFQRNQAQLALELQLQNIRPGRLPELQKATDRTNRAYRLNFGRQNDDNTGSDFEIGLKETRSFCIEGFATNQRTTPFFYHILDAVFQEGTVNESALLQVLMKKVRQSFKERHDNNYFPTTVRRAIGVYAFFDHLGLFTKPKYSIMDTTQTAWLSPEDYLDQHRKFYDAHPALRGAFLLGCLTGKLTYAQYKSIGATPFLNQLNNLKLSRAELLGLAPRVLNKIQQYQQRSNVRNLYPLTVNELYTAATSALALDSDTKLPSRDELSFAFTSGLTAQQVIDRNNVEARKEANAQAETE